MGLQYRRLLPENETLDACCDDDTDSSGYCPPKCLGWCSEICPNRLPPPPPPPPPNLIFTHHLEHKTKKILFSTLSISITIFILVCCYVAYVKFFSGSSRRRRQRDEDQEEEEEQRTEIQQEFLDEDHGPMVDHPIWYIRTVGLQPSVISSISVFRYKRGEGLVESTDCSICLSEFEEDETLRLLPKCSHAFHIPCIDTWLRSHTNCPICRAPILANTNRATTSSEANTGSSSSGEDGAVEVAEQDGQERVDDREVEREGHEDGLEEEDELQADNRRKRSEVFDEDENGIQPLRRSVSLDSLSALKISQVLSSLPTQESHQNCDSWMVEASESHTGIVSRRGGGTNQGLLSFMASSSVGRSFQSFQIGPSSIKRSFSCSAKLFLPRHSRS